MIECGSIKARKSKLLKEFSGFDYYIDEQPSRAVSRGK